MATVTTTALGAAGDFCTNLNALLATNDELIKKFYAGDTSEVADLVDDLPVLAEAADRSAPPDLADEFDLILPFIDREMKAIEGVDLSDAEAVIEAINIDMDEVTGLAFGTMLTRAGTDCGYSSGLVLEDPPEPPDCEVLDPAVSAEAAGVDIDVSDSGSGGSFSLPGFAIKGCGYGGGLMVLSTITYTDLEETVNQYPANLENNGGKILNTDIGRLPATSLVVRQNGVVTVTVFEADIPFAVGFGDDVAPAKVVAATEAILATQG